MEHTDYKNLFESFNHLNVLIIGDVMVDSYLWGNVDRISPEAPVPIVNVTKHESRTGGAANVAINLKALGATPILVSMTGSDRGHESAFARTVLFSTRQIAVAPGSTVQVNPLRMTS